MNARLEDIMDELQRCMILCFLFVLGIERGYAISMDIMKYKEVSEIFRG